MCYFLDLILIRSIIYGIAVDFWYFFVSTQTVTVYSIYYKIRNSSTNKNIRSAYIGFIALSSSFTVFLMIIACINFINIMTVITFCVAANGNLRKFTCSHIYERCFCSMLHQYVWKKVTWIKRKLFYIYMMKYRKT